MMDWLFNANAAPGSPESYQAQQMRQKIAMAMLAQGGRKGYPKTFGEGLTAIGDALGERGQMNMMSNILAKQEAARAQAAPPVVDERGGEPRAEDTTTEPPVRTASLAQEVEEEQPARSVTPPIPPTPLPPNLPPAVTTALQPPQAQPQMAQSWNRAPNDFRDPASFPGPDAARPNVNPQLVSLGTDNYQPNNAVGGNRAPWFPGAVGSMAYQPPQPRSEVAGDEFNYPQTAALQTGSTMSDAPPLGIQRAQTPQAFPPVTPGATVPPTTLAALQATSPDEAQNNRPIVVPDIRPQQVAQGMTQPQPLTPQPTPPVQAPGVYAKPDLPPRPNPILPGADEKYWKSKADRNDALGGDPVISQGWRAKEKEFTDRRKENEALMVKDWELKHGAAVQQLRAWEDAQRGMGKSQAETSEAQAKALDAMERSRLTKRFSVPPDQFLPEMKKRRDDAAMTTNTLQSLKEARSLIDQGVVSGYGATARIDLEKLKAWAFKNKRSDDLAANTEYVKSLVNSTLGSAVKSFQTQGPTTEGDIRLATTTTGADPRLQAETQKKIIDHSIGESHRKLNEYEDHRDHYLSGETLFRDFRIPADAAAPKDYIDRLIKNQDAPGAIENFDRRFGKGAAELEIARAKRRARHPQDYGGD